MTQETNALLSFEQAYARLEEILEQMNSGKISLDDSLKLYEEADRLIASCFSRLNDAEQKIEMLIKKRSGDLMLDADGKPQTRPFAPESLSALNLKDVKSQDESECPF